MKKLLLATVATLLATTGAVHAQDRGAAARQQLETRFAAADKDHDGKLTKNEMEAGMPRLAPRFADIDVPKTGAVTLAQIEQYMAASKR